MTSYIGKHVYIKSSGTNLHLACSSKNMVYTHPNRGSKEKFYLSGSATNLMIRSHTGWYLGSDSTGKLVYVSSASSSLVKWSMIDWHGHVVLKSNYNNRYLNFTYRPTQAEFYQHCNYGGWVKKLAPGNYPNVTSVGIRNDDMSSIKVPPGVRVILYEHGNFGGHSWNIPPNTDLNCFNNNTMSSRTVGWRWYSRTVRVSWNDQVSSVRVQRDGNSYEVDTIVTPNSDCIVDFSEPNELSISWSMSGKVPSGMKTIHCNIPARKHWNDNYLCSSVELPWKWVTTQSEVNKWTSKSYRFIRWIEGSDPVFMSNPIGFCIPKRTNIDLKWASSDGSIDALAKEGYHMVKIRESSEPSDHTWNDNWIAYKEVVPEFDKISLGFGLELWSGGWANSSCRNKSREGIFRVNVNGKEVGRGSRGISMIVLDENGNKTYHGDFDTYANTSASDALIHHINRLCSNISDDRIVIFGVQDEASNKLSTNYKNLMAEKGAAMFSQLTYRGSYLFVYRPRDGAVIYEAIDNCGDVHYKYDCGVKCNNIYSRNYYKSHNPDANDPDSHWEKIGVKEGRQGHPKFDAKDYKLLYEDVAKMTNEQAIKHYVAHGSKKGRIGTIFNPTYSFGGLLTNHLMCFLDASNKKSYSYESGNTWYDLSGNNNNFVFQDKPLTDGMSLLDIDRYGKTATLPDISSLKISPRGGYTVIMVARQKELSANLALWAYGTGNKDFYIHWSWDDQKTYFGNSGCCTDQTTRNWYRLPKDTWNKEMMIAYVFTIDGGLDIFIDGTRVVRGKRGTAKSFGAAGQLILNKDKKWKADIKMVMVYNYGMPKSYIKKIWNWFDQTNKAKLLTRMNDGEALTKKHLPFYPVPRGVQIYLSANNIKSYVNGSTTVKDLSGHNRNFTFQKKPKLVDGKWIINGYNTLKGPASSSIGIEGDSDYCIIFRIKTNTLNTCSLFNIYGNHHMDRGIFCHPVLTNARILFDQGALEKSPGDTGVTKGLARLVHDIPDNWGDITTYALSRNAKGRHIYINGVKVISTKERGTAINFTADKMELFSTKHYKIWNGEMSDFIVYNRGLSSSEVMKVTKYVNNPYSVRNSSWDEASQYCLRQGKQLCQLDELCYSGKAIDPASMPNALAPIGDRPGSWLNLSNCKVTTNQGTIANAHVKCCPLPKRAPYFETCFLQDGWIYFFKDTMILKYQLDSHVSEGPISLNHEFPGLPTPFSEGNIDAVCSVGNKLYIVKDRLALLYDRGTKKVINGPGSISQILPGIKGTFKKGYLDAILTHPFDTNVVYIIKGNRFCNYNISSKTGTQPQKLNSKTGGWRNLHGFFENKLNAAITVKASGTGFIFFKEDQYLDYSTQKIGNIVPEWHGLIRPFVTDGQYCSILDKRIQHFRKKTEEFRNSNPKLYEINAAILKDANKNKAMYCEKVSVQSYLDRLKKEKDRQQQILSNIKNLQFRQGQTQNQTKELVNQHSKTVALIDELNTKIAIEEKKTCPVDATCKPAKVPIQKTNKDKTKQQCTSSMMTHLMKKKGYTSDQIDQLTNTLNYVPTINDYDIRTHKNFYQYVEKGGVKVCPPASASAKAKQQKILNNKAQHLSPTELLETLYTSNKYKKGLKQLDMLDHVQRKREIKDIVKHHEDIAVKLLREAVLKYHMEHVAKTIPDFMEKAQNANSLKEFSKETDRIVSDMKIGNGIAMHLALLKEIQNILKDITLHPKYQSLTADIDNITKEIKRDSKKLSKSTISTEVDALQDKLNKSHKLLLKKTGKLERFISRLEVDKS